MLKSLLEIFKLNKATDLTIKDGARIIRQGTDRAYVGQFRVTRVDQTETPETGFFGRRAFVLADTNNGSRRLILKTENQHCTIGANVLIQIELEEDYIESETPSYDQSKSA